MITDNASKQKNLNLPATFYAALLPRLRSIAAKYGYALAIHGSMTRDFDLIAVPWQKWATDHLAMVTKIRDDLGGWFHSPDPQFESLIKDGAASRKPHARIAYSIHLTEYGADGPYVDISVVPSVPERVSSPATSVSASPASMNAYHWTEETVLNIRSNSGDISDQQVIADAHNDAIDAAIKSEREPFIPSSPSPLVSVEEWTEALCDQFCDEVQIGYSCKQEYLDKREELKKRLRVIVNASLDSLTAEIERLKHLATDKWKREGVEGGFVYYFGDMEAFVPSRDLNALNLFDDIWVKRNAEVASLTSRLEEATKIGNDCAEELHKLAKLAGLETYGFDEIEPSLRAFLAVAEKNSNHIPEPGDLIP